MARVPQQKNDAPAETTGTKPTFEQAISSLESILEQLESNDLTLDKALAHFEDGIHLMRTCDAHLKNAQGRLRELLKGENGEFVEKVLGITLDSFIGQEGSDG